MTKKVLNAYQKAIKMLADHIKEHNMKGFIRDFQSASEHLGKSTTTAYQRTNALLQKAKQLI